MRNNFDKKSIYEIAKEISPDAIYCSGWIDKDYLSLCGKFKNKIPVILGFDNKWKGSIKQKLASSFSGITVLKYFSHCWIPGKPQLEFAKRLGFDEKNILKGFYSCDYNKFHTLYLKFKEHKEKKFPHRFIFSGRYTESKGIQDLWKSFIEIQNETPYDWELWCLGTGSINPIVHPKIKHFGFVQSNNIEKFIAEAGVFVLPSTFEPWGVAVHEFASAGFPLICSSEVGAADIFLRDGENGFLFKPGNVSDFKKVMKKIFSLSDEQLFIMGEKSVELAKQITPEKWADTLMSIIKN
ncbi:MAG: glycosyltransferase [Bacteroidetes bacterium]|nr:glycosyltransferase [Bacteroidota bacterium]